jgi:hypothetical protein
LNNISNYTISHAPHIWGIFCLFLETAHNIPDRKILDALIYKLSCL